MSFRVYQLMEDSSVKQWPLRFAFTDLFKALDLVDRDPSFIVLSKPTLLSPVKPSHAGMTSKVQYDGDKSDNLPVDRGVKQGCVLAPTLQMFSR